MNEADLREMNGYFWWHKIKLDDEGTVTPGICPHGTGTDIETRFGLPKDMKGMKVLDVGTWDGLFAFEAEKRGAQVHAIDIYQKCAGQKSEAIRANRPFQFAKEQLKSDVRFSFENLESFTSNDAYPFKYDYIFYFGVMYHVENPLGAVKQLIRSTKSGGIILVETAICNHEEEPLLAYRPGHQNDKTNIFYPNPKWVEEAFLTNGAKSVEMFYSDPERATFKIST